MVGHVKNYGVDEDSRVEVYLPYYQSPVASATLIVRAEKDPAAPAAASAQAVKAVDPEVPLYAVRTLAEIVSDRTAQRRLAVMLITVFAAVALAPGRGRDLRRDVVRGRAADAGDRHPHGAGRGAPATSCAWCCGTAASWR